MPVRLAGEHEPDGQPRSSRSLLQLLQRFDGLLGVFDAADLPDELLDGEDLLLGQVRQAGSQGPLEVLESESASMSEPSSSPDSIYMSSRQGWAWAICRRVAGGLRAIG